MMAEKNIPLVTTLSVSLGLADMKGLPDYMMKKAKHIMLKDLMILPILKMRTDYFVNILEVDFLRKNRI